MKIFNKNFAYGAAALLFGAVGMASCSSDEEVAANVNPTYDGKSVKTQFAINIPYGSSNTRMTDVNTQNKNNFLGMTNVRLLSFDGVPGTATTFSSMIPLTDISGITATTSSKIYSDVNVPVGTDHFLFYASAPMGTNASTKFAQGSIKSTFDDQTTLSGIKFELDPVDSKNKTAETALTNVLSNVAKVTNWSDGPDVDANLQALYKSFITLKAGSANNIRLALQNLYNQVESWIDGSDASATVAQDIRNAITNGGTFSVTGSSAPYTLTTSLKYPEERNLPDGAVELTFEPIQKTFTYIENTSSIIGGLSALDVSKVCYPAALYYFVNTDVAASDAELASENWPTSTTGWTTTAPWVTGTWGNEVLATTRTIALKKNIQYAVANMKLTVKCATSSLKDKGTDANPAVSVTVPTAGFPVTGVLIGGQPSQADWKLEPMSTATFDYTVYDKVATGVNAKAGIADGENYTMLLSDMQETAQPVNFAIELENNSGVEFRGVDGVVPVGGKFYLVGQLNPAGKAVDRVSTPHVFMADYQTVVNASISTLANAYNTIPDLRATKMQLGLSVDLVWKTGILFDDVVVGAN